jgi:CBS domain-containing protein
VAEALALLKEYNLGAVVVSTDVKEISGILTERDGVRRLFYGPDFLDSPVSDEGLVRCSRVERVSQFSR